MMILVPRFDEVTEDQRVTRLGHLEHKREVWAYLVQKDRHLLELHSRGMSYRQIGEVLKMHNGSVCRRIVAIQTRLGRPIVRSLELVAEKLDPLDRTIARHHFIGGLVVSKIARLLTLSPGSVQRRIAYLTGLLEEVARHQNRFR